MSSPVNNQNFLTWFPFTSHHFLHIIFFDMNKSKGKINKLTARKFQLTEVVFSEFMSIEAKKL